ncbi:hypothetical protein [Nocardioides sp. Kera G14]|uniref:hypothetical protein n=1 Tax=Nocardioides sp. Kera G14 TaxID=2884264 RepID=UPI001D10A729|nr:hypothetical protein [Nocardioides sp. Kera G14]UDY24491.1 hypothetical protein LH076_04090 [Nocardioides sp. Kera G14]
MEIVEVDSMPDVRAVSNLFTEVWGRTDEGAPLHSDVMKSLIHAGGAVTVARDGERLLGAAVLTPGTPAGSAYSLLAAVAPGTVDRGTGRALKLRQREWALQHGFTEIRWTFDPLVARNARFNLSVLGATASEYEEAFYGVMSDDLNGEDEADRLVAVWDLSPEPEPEAPEVPLGGEPVADGPDGDPFLRTEGDSRWLRVPRDVVALRRTMPEQASAWRTVVREQFLEAFGAGLVASGVSRSSWYHLTPRGAPRSVS